MYASRARELVLNLHEWAVRVGLQEAVTMGFEVLQSSRDWNLDHILVELEARSGVPIGKGQ
jgi:hypothetical protein